MLRRRFDSFSAAPKNLILAFGRQKFVLSSQAWEFARCVDLIVAFSLLTTKSIVASRA
jgi:hypothetical protein